MNKSDNAAERVYQWMGKHDVVLPNAAFAELRSMLSPPLARAQEAAPDHYKVLFNFAKLGHEQSFAKCQQLSALLRRSLQQLAKWQAKYGERQPEWLPPAGDVRLAEDIDAALAPHAPAPVQAAEPAARFSCHLERDFGKTPCDRDCGKLRCMYPSEILATPADSAQPATLPGRIAELIEQHGSLRAAARVLDCDPGYLSRLQSGEKDDPGAHLLRRMGMRQIVTYERT